MVSLDFITKNPALDEFNRQQKELRDQQLADSRSALMAGQTNRLLQQTDFDTQSAPSRLRAIDAGATSAESNARVNVGTETPRIERPAAELEDFQGEAGVRRATAPTRVERADVGLRQARADLGSSEVEAGVRAATAPTRIEAAKSGLRKTNAEATNSELQGFYKSLEALERGDTEAAKQIAKASGQELTDEHINDAELRRSLTTAAKRAQELYPNRPKDQQAFIQGRIDDMNDRRSRGLPTNNPTDNYSLPTGAPPPPEMASNSKEHQPADVQIAEWLRSKGIARTDEEAWRMARHARENPEAIYSQVYNSALRANGGDSAAAKQAADDFLRARDARLGQPVPAPAAPAPAAPLPGRPVAPAGPAQQRPDMMTPGNGTKPVTSVMPPGSGSREQPYQATVQEHVDWFRQNAPPGAIIVVNGQPYTK